MLRSRQAFVYMRPDGLLVGTYSGPGAAVQEDWDQGAIRLEPLNLVDHGELGAAVRLSLSRCRETPLRPYKEVIAKHCAVVGMTNLKALYAGVRLVSPFLKAGVLEVGATNQVRSGEFAPVPESVFKMPEAVADEVLGARIIAALDASSARPA